MKSGILLGATLVLVLSSGAAFAQEARNAARTVELSYFVDGFVRTGGANRFGRCSDVAVTMTDSVALVAEICGTHQVAAEKEVDSLGSLRGGPRLSKRHGSRITTFVQGVAGGESGFRQAGIGADLGFSLAAGGGVDVALKNWFGLRIVQASYQMTRVGGTTVTGVRIGWGVVFRIGKREEITK